MCMAASRQRDVATQIVSSSRSTLWPSTPPSPSASVSRSSAPRSGSPQVADEICRIGSGIRLLALVGGRDAGADLLLERDQPLHHGLGPGRAAGHVDVD